MNEKQVERLIAELGRIADYLHVSRASGRGAQHLIAFDEDPARCD